MNLEKSVDGIYLAVIDTQDGKGGTVEKQYRLSPLNLNDFATAIKCMQQLKMDCNGSIPTAANFLCYNPIGLRLCLSIAAAKNHDEPFNDIMDVLNPEFSPKLIDVALDLCGYKDEPETKDEDNDSKN
jgi:hypothetical protein